MNLGWNVVEPLVVFVMVLAVYLLGMALLREIGR